MRKFCSDNRDHLSLRACRWEGDWPQLTQTGAAPETSSALHVRSGPESQLAQRLAFHSETTDIETAGLTLATPAVPETEGVYVDPCAAHRSDTHRVELYRTQPCYYVSRSLSVRFRGHSPTLHLILLLAT